MPLAHHRHQACLGVAAGGATDMGRVVRGHCRRGCPVHSLLLLLLQLLLLGPAQDLRRKANSCALLVPVPPHSSTGVPQAIAPLGGLPSSVPQGVSP